VSYLVRFVRFWYDFIVGDDWTVAVTVVVAVAVTWAVADRGGVAWWILPAAVLVTLGVSVLRARRAIRKPDGAVD
jgi:hypothetical protein